MQPNLAIICAVYAVPILMGAWFVTRVARRDGVVECPKCCHRIPALSKTAGQGCPRCGDTCPEDQFERDDAILPEAEDRCAHCQQVGVPNAVKLWDGKQYCSECVKAEEPDLYAWALRHRRLAEVMPQSAWSVAGAMCVYCLFVFWPIGIAFSVSLRSILPFVGLMVVTLPVVVLWTVGGNRSHPSGVQERGRSVVETSVHRIHEEL